MECTGEFNTKQLNKGTGFCIVIPLATAGACHAPGLPYHDIGIIVKAQVLRGLIKLLKTINPQKYCNVSYGVAIINQILLPLQLLLQDTKEMLHFIGISLQWVWVLAYV
jgi:hypothetical protein